MLMTINKILVMGTVIDELKEKYNQALSFEHIKLDNFLHL